MLKILFKFRDERVSLFRVKAEISFSKDLRNWIQVPNLLYLHKDLYALLWSNLPKNWCRKIVREINLSFLTPGTVLSRENSVHQEKSRKFQKSVKKKFLRLLAFKGTLEYTFFSLLSVEGEFLWLLLLGQEKDCKNLRCF